MVDPDHFIWWNWIIIPVESGAFYSVVSDHLYGVSGSIYLVDSDHFKWGICINLPNGSRHSTWGIRSISSNGSGALYPADQDHLDMIQHEKSLVRKQLINNASNNITPDVFCHPHSKLVNDYESTSQS